MVKFICDLCDKKLSSKFNLRRHKQKIHLLQDNSFSDKCRLICPENCGERFSRESNLRDHLNISHNINILCEDLVFLSDEDFENWLYNMQNNTCSEYIKECSTKVMADGFRKTYLYCNRSYSRKIITHRKRTLKSKGSKKIGVCCPSRIEVLRKGHGGNDQVSVKFWKTHCGHVNDIGHLRIDRRSKNELAGKLKAGVKHSKVLSDIRDGKCDSFSKRAKLTDHQDLRNICRDYKIESSIKRHENDAVSVKLWVSEQMNLGEDSPVLLYKQQGEEHAELQKQDFMLVIMTKFQVLQAEKFARHGKICIDGTHGTNPYDIQLFTLLTVDEFSTGCPIAFCFSNRADEHALKLFFDAVKSKVGTIDVDLFMSDDAPAFINAWKSIMTIPKHNLLCSWHVDKCWQNNLSKIKGGPEKKKMVYKTLRTVMEYSSKEKFDKILNNTVKELKNDEDTQLFGNYFETFYASRPETWAYCFRFGLGLNTNNHLEAFHKQLKYSYLEGKKIKRLDKSIEALMSLARDSLFKRIIKLSKDTPSDRNYKINKSHFKSLGINSDKISTNKPGVEWIVKSCSSSNHEYVVKKMQDMCSDPCMKCVTCGICVHSFQCSCMDNLIHLNICKHIHACSRLFFPIPSLQTQLSSGCTGEELDTLFNLTVKCQREDNTSDQILLQKTSVLFEMLSKSTPENKTDIAKHLDKAIDLANKTALVSLTNKMDNPINTNANIDKQIRFFSTKRRKLHKKETSFKPTVNEKENIAGGLLAPDEPTLNVHTGSDHSYCS